MSDDLGPIEKIRKWVDYPYNSPETIVVQSDLVTFTADDLARLLQERDEAAARIRELEAELAALREARGGRVKPLVWKKEIPSANPSYSPNIAWTEFGLIYANEHAFWFEGEEAVKCQGCRETTKAAAQADYERRVFAALEQAPVTPAEAARVLLCDQDAMRAMCRAAASSRAHDDEGQFEPLLDLINFSGENKTRMVIFAAIYDALRALADAGESG